MRYMKLILAVISCMLLACVLSACEHENKDTLKVGTIAGPESQLMEVAKQVAKNKFGLNIKIIEFTDYVEPNTALSEGSINANMFQHLPYLQQQIKDHHYKFTVAAKTFVYPMGIYSQKIKNLQSLRNDGIVSIPNDPSNEGRALLLLKTAGVIDLNPSSGLYATPKDIIKNPKHLQFKELDAAQLARSLPDVDIGIINSNYAIPAGLSPSKDAIFHEGKDSPYANVIVIRQDESNDPRVPQLVAAIHSKEVLKAAEQIFNDQAIPAWF